MTIRAGILCWLALAACGGHAPLRDDIWARDTPLLPPDALAQWCKDPGDPGLDYPYDDLVPLRFPLDSSTAGNLAGEYTLILRERDRHPWESRGALSLRSDTSGHSYCLRRDQAALGRCLAAARVVLRATGTQRFPDGEDRPASERVELIRGPKGASLRLDFGVEEGWMLYFQTRDSLGLKGSWYWWGEPGEDLPDGYFCALRRGPAV